MFDEQTEALCLDRQAHFEKALLKGKPLRPRPGREWTLGDLLFLSQLVNKMLEEELGGLEPLEADLRSPLSTLYA